MKTITWYPLHLAPVSHHPLQKCRGKWKLVNQPSLIWSISCRTIRSQRQKLQMELARSLYSNYFVITPGIAKAELGWLQSSFNSRNWDFIPHQVNYLFTDGSSKWSFIVLTRNPNEIIVFFYRLQHHYQMVHILVKFVY